MKFKLTTVAGKRKIVFFEFAERKEDARSQGIRYLRALGLKYVNLKVEKCQLSAPR